MSSRIIPVLEEIYFTLGAVQRVRAPDARDTVAAAACEANTPGLLVRVWILTEQKMNS